MRRAGLLAVALAGLACGGSEPGVSSRPIPEPAMARRGSAWAVFRGETPVLRMRNEPGPILRDNGSEVAPSHPFAALTLLSANDEVKLLDLLKRSRHFRDFVENLDRSGYRVSPDPTAESSAASFR